MSEFMKVLLGEPATWTVLLLLILYALKRGFSIRFERKVEGDSQEFRLSLSAGVREERLKEAARPVLPLLDSSSKQPPGDTKKVPP